MTRTLRLVVASLAAGCMIGVGAPAQEGETSVDAVLGEIQKGIHLARQTLAGDPSLPRLDHVEVSLNTVLKKSGGGGFKILIFSFGKKWEKESVQKLTLKLKPYGSSNLAGAPKPPLSEQLANAIVGAVRGVSGARSHADVPLELQKLSVEIGFIVRTEGTGGVSGKFSVEPVSVEIEGKGGVSNEALQKLTVVLENPPPSPPPSPASAKP